MYRCSGSSPGQPALEIIGSEFLHSYIQPEDDADMDGLPDAWETSVGLDPTDGAGGGYLDHDLDGLRDIEEYQMGLSPFVPLTGGLPGCLLVERWNSVNGLTVSDLVESDRFGGEPDCVEYRSLAEYPIDSADGYGLRMRGTITAPTNGVYTFALTGDNTAQVWLSSDASPYGRKLLLDLVDYTNFRELSSGAVPYAAVELAEGQVCYVEILLKDERPGQPCLAVLGSVPARRNLK